MTPEFKAWEKIFRFNREWVASEKIDGTSGIIFIPDFNDPLAAELPPILAGSRNKWITPTDDNAGFAKWVESHKDELIQGLGPGYHYGEWWGAGIQRKYGLKEKRFSLFNTTRWTEESKPACCHVVPVLARGTDARMVCEVALDKLRLTGSVASPGFPDPEGIVLFHTPSCSMFKITIKNDSEPKGK